MILDEEIKSEIREVFEKPERYDRRLNDDEVQEIADNLVNFGEVLINYARRKSDEKYKNKRS